MTLTSWPVNLLALRMASLLQSVQYMVSSKTVMENGWGRYSVEWRMTCGYKCLEINRYKCLGMNRYKRLGMDSYTFGDEWIQMFGDEQINVWGWKDKNVWRITETNFWGWTDTNIWGLTTEVKCNNKNGTSNYIILMKFFISILPPYINWSTKSFHSWSV